MKLFKPQYLIFGLLSALLLGGIVIPGLKTSSIPESKRDFVLTKFSGGEGKLSDYRGQVVFLNFWASWCASCREETPDLVKAHRKYKDRGFTVVGVNYGEVEGAAREFIETYGATEYPHFFDFDKSVSGKFGVLGMPTSFILDREGNIAFAIYGQINFAEELPKIEALLAEQKS